MILYQIMLYPMGAVISHVPATLKSSMVRDLAAKQDRLSASPYHSIVSYYSKHELPKAGFEEGTQDYFFASRYPEVAQALYDLRAAEDVSEERTVLRRLSGAYTKLSCQQLVRSADQTQLKAIAQTLKDQFDDSGSDKDVDTSMNESTLRYLYKAVAEFLDEPKTESEAESELESEHEVEAESVVEQEIAEGVDATETEAIVPTVILEEEEEELESALSETEAEPKERYYLEDFACIHYAFQAQVGNDSYECADTADADFVMPAFATAVDASISQETVVAEPFATEVPSAGRVVCDAVTSRASPFIVSMLLAFSVGIDQECVEMVLDEKHLCSDPMVYYLASLRAKQLPEEHTLEDWADKIPAALSSSLCNLSKIGNLTGTQVSASVTRKSAAVAALAPLAHLQTALASSLSSFNAYFAALQPGLEASVPAPSAIASFGLVLEESSVARWAFARESNDASSLIASVLDNYSVSHNSIDIYADEVDGIQRALDSKYFYLVQPSHKVVIGRVIPCKTRAFALQETIPLRFMVALCPWVLQLRSVILEDGSVLVLDASRGIYTRVGDNESKAIPRVFAEQLIQEHALTLIYESI